MGGVLTYNACFGLKSGGWESNNNSKNHESIQRLQPGHMPENRR